MLLFNNCFYTNKWNLNGGLQTTGMGKNGKNCRFLTNKKIGIHLQWKTNRIWHIGF